VSVLGTVRSRVARMLPYRVRRRLRAMLEPPLADPRDVARVQTITASHWREGYSPRYLESYWDAIDTDRDSVGTRRSRWLAELPPFRDAASALELGCGPGRNLWTLQQRYPAMTLHGVDINPDGIAYARTRVRGDFVAGDLYQLPVLLGDRRVDVIFTMGVLIHLHPDTLPALLQAMRAHARRWLVFVEQVSATNEVVKGPARWAPSRKVTGDYIQWSPDLPGMLRRLGIGFEHTPLPEALHSNGARDLLVVKL
jgi:SAM-dependent methyltransferase